MSIELSFYNIILPKAVIDVKYPGGWDNFLETSGYQNNTSIWFDNYLFRDGAMNTIDIELKVQKLVDKGFTVYQEGTKYRDWGDICILDTLGTVGHRCEWLEICDGKAELRNGYFGKNSIFDWDLIKTSIMGRMDDVYTCYRNNPIKGAEGFLDVICQARNEFIDFTHLNALNYGSFGGILLEWIYTFFIDACIKGANKQSRLKVVNRYQLRTAEKIGKSKFKCVNLDVALIDVATSKIVRCFEIKTNGEDGFDKYYVEYNAIKSGVDSVSGDFKYHYICGYRLPKKVKMSQEAQQLKESGEFWDFQYFDKHTIGDDYSHCVEKAMGFMQDVIQVIEKYLDRCS